MATGTSKGLGAADAVAAPAPAPAPAPAETDEPARRGEAAADNGEAVAEEAAEEAADPLLADMGEPTERALSEGSGESAIVNAEGPDEAAVNTAGRVSSSAGISRAEAAEASLAAEPIGEASADCGDWDDRGDSATDRMAVRRGGAGR